MSLRREVLVRILALLQRKTLIETKSRTLKCLKWHYSFVRSMKNVAVLTEDGAFALFFRPHPGGFHSSRIPTPGNLSSKAKKMLMPGSQPGGGAGRRWNWLVHNVIHMLICDKQVINNYHNNYHKIYWLYLVLTRCASRLDMPSNNSEVRFRCVAVRK